MWRIWGESRRVTGTLGKGMVVERLECFRVRKLSEFSVGRLGLAIDWIRE